MKNPLKNYLSANEQKLLLVLALFLIFGSLLQLMGFNPEKRAAHENSLKAAVEVDYLLKIDIRSANLAELMALKGIGEKRAQDIIDYRAHTPFENVYEITNIRGIGAKTYEKILPNLVVFGDSLFTEKSAATPAKTKKSKADTFSGVLNINTANLEELCQLSGIGAVKAQAIIDYREQHGPFQNVEELCNVKGIGTATLNKNLDKITCGDAL